MPEHRLSEAEIERYRREGYVVVERVLQAKDLKKIDRIIQEIAEKALSSGEYSKVLEVEPEKVNGKVVTRRIYNPFEQHEAFRALACDERIIGRIVSLIGEDMSLQHSKLNMKPAKVGSVVEWHQDFAYFPHTNDDLVTTLVYLDDATEENGCLQVLPRHHHHYFDHTSPEGFFAGMITEDLTDGRFGRPQPLPAPAGSVIFMHCMLPHSSLPNRSDKSRRTLIYEYRAADSFPIHYGEKTTRDEEHAFHLRGKPAPYARFGNLPPLIPRFPENVKSLYQLQEDTKARAAELKGRVPSLIKG